MTPTRLFTLASLVGLLASGCASRPSVVETVQMAPQQPIVIAHRGASGYLPEHTLEAALMSYAQGADFIEQDLVLSQDGALIVLHDIHLERTTDVEQKFPNRARDDGRFYALDFTLDELKTLIVHERQTADGKQVYPNRYLGTAPFKIATFEEQIVTVKHLNKLNGTKTGIYPEIKSPAWHRAQGHDISRIVVETLRKYQLDEPDSNVYLQCFDFNEIKRIRRELGAQVKLVQLLADNSWYESDNDYNFLRSAQGLAQIAEYADGIGPWFAHLVDPETRQLSSLVEDAKALDLDVHPYTFRKDQLPVQLTSEQTLEILFKTLKVDGVFTDHTDTVIDYLRK